jgi:uncharacterized protein (DUF1684 family)
MELRKINTVNRRHSRVLAALFVAAAAGCNNPKPPDERSYIDRITVVRVDKDEFFRTSKESPVPENRKADLLPLPYFPIAPGYNVPAALKLSNDDSVIQIPTSAGTVDPFRRVGTLEFTLDGQPMALTAYAPAAARTIDRLFVPFKDLTNGEESYEGGRYLDLDRTATGVYQIDFNLAYTPSCYFNPTFICPYPPRENHLKVRIEAGEKTKVKG